MYSHFQTVQLLIEMDPLLCSTGVLRKMNKYIIRLLHSFLHSLSKGAPAKISIEKVWVPHFCRHKSRSQSHSHLTIRYVILLPYTHLVSAFTVVFYGLQLSFLIRHRSNCTLIPLDILSVCSLSEMYMPLISKSGWTLD